MITNVTDLGEASDVEFCGAKLRHDGSGETLVGSKLAIWGRCRGYELEVQFAKIRDPYDINQSATLLLRFHHHHFL